MLGIPCLLREFKDFELHEVPVGYDVEKSVHRVDAIMAQSAASPEVSTPLKSSAVQKSEVAASEISSAAVNMGPGGPEEHMEPSTGEGSEASAKRKKKENARDSGPKSSEAEGQETAPGGKENKGGEVNMEPSIGEGSEPSAKRKKKEDACDSGPKSSVAEGQETAPGGKENKGGEVNQVGTDEAAALETGKQQKKVPKPDVFVRLTPGVVRYMATLLIAKNWDTLSEFVECTGATPTEKLATFKKGMAKHGVTEVSPNIYIIPNTSSSKYFILHSPG